MYYQINDARPVKCELDDISKESTYIAYLTVEEFYETYDKLGIKENILHYYMDDKNGFHAGIEIYEDFSFGFINIVNVLNLREERDRIAFILAKNKFILIKIFDKNNSCLAIFEDAMDRYRTSATLEKVVYAILDRLLVGGHQSLETMEKKIMNMEKELVEGKISMNLNRDVYILRKELTTMRKYYDRMFVIGQELSENRNDIFTDDHLRFFKIFADKSDRLSRGSQELREGLIHIREASDAAMNYNLNTTIKMFTVVTTIFLPLTLIVGWYGMNFTNMPELSWKYGYLMVKIISICVIIISLIWFRKKRLI